MTTSPTANSPEHSYGLEPENLTDYRAIIRSVIVYGKTVLRHEISGLLRQPAKDFDYGAFDHRGLLVAEFEPDNITYLIRPDVLEFTHDRCQAYAVTDIAFLTEPQKTDTLLALMAEKNPAVFNYLYQYELPGIIALVMRNSGNEESGKDIFQEAVLRVTEKVCTGTLSLKCTFSTFLYSVARNLWFNELRKKNHQVTLMDTCKFCSVEIPEEPAAEPDRYALIAEAMNTLSDSCRRLLLYFYFYQYNWEKIADKLDYSTAACARNQKYQCMKRLRERLKV